MSLADLQLNDAMKSLSDGYDVGRINLKTVPFNILMKIKLLVIPKPDTKFTNWKNLRSTSISCAAAGCFGPLTR